MNFRHLRPVLAWSAAGLLGLNTLAPSAAFAGPDETAPLPVTAETATVSILDAQRSGDVAVELRGAGQQAVTLSVRNMTDRRLQVVLPPGLVASSAAAQPGGGGGFQSMGLGAVSNRAGSFGEFRAADRRELNAFQAVAVTANEANGLFVPAGQSVDLAISAVCLNYGAPTPTPRDDFQLVSVDDYTTDARARKALKSLAVHGSSHGVAQAAVWSVFNGVPFDLMARKGGKLINTHEIALASRFVEVLDASADAELVDPAYLQEGRLFVTVTGEGALADDARRLASEIDGLTVMGLPARSGEGRSVGAPALQLNVVLTAGATGETKGRIYLKSADASGEWTAFGKTAFVEPSSASVVDGAGLVRAVERSVSSAFVTARPARREVGLTTFKVQNGLPFTLGSVVFKAGASAGSPEVELSGLGVAPGRSGLAPVASPVVTVERVELNGL